MDCKKFADSLDLDYPILSDESTEVAKKFGVVSGSGKNAKRVTFYIGADGKILHIDDQVKTGSHGEDVAAKLQELGVAQSDEEK